MKKVTLYVQETLKYTRDVVVEVPDNMTDGQLEYLLDKVQSRAESVDDAVYALRDRGINLCEPYDTDLDSPSHCEIEIDDYQWHVGEENEAESNQDDI